MEDKPKQPSLPGSGLIRVGGILLIVFAALGVAFGPLTIVGGMTLSSPEMAAFLPAGQSAAMADSAIRSGGVMTATSVLALIGGILAVRFRGKPARRGVCVAVAVILMVSQLAGETVLALFGEFDLVSAVIRLAFPLLVFAGAVQPVKSAAFQRAVPAEPAPEAALPEAAEAALPGTASEGEPETAEGAVPEAADADNE